MQTSAHDDAPTGQLSRFFAWAKETSSNYRRLVTWIVIAFICAQVGLRYLGKWQVSESYADRAFVFTVLLLLLGASIYQEWSKLRKERYSTIFGKLQAIASIVKDLNTYLLRQDPERSDLDDLKRSVHNDLQRVLDTLEDVFTFVTGTQCRTTIKVLFQADAKLYLYTLARDSQSGRTNAARDVERRNNKADPLEDNEDFLSVFDQTQEFFIENNLPARRQYQNTSFKIYGYPSTGTGFWDRWFPSMGWKLPYKSAMCFPIRQMEPTTGGADAAGCIGFLSVDSAAKKVFEATPDGPLGAAVASALFHPLAVYERLVDQITERGNQA
jgi:hypothetical protein